MPLPVTQKTLADSLGLHQVTVSKALRNHPEIAESTRKLVWQRARELGYKPNPGASALAELRRDNQRFKGTIACLVGHKNTNPLTDPNPIYDHYRSIYAAASSRAQAIGYQLEPFWIYSAEHKGNRLARILAARGVETLLFTFCRPEETKLDLSKFTAVYAGRASTESSELPYAIVDYYDRIYVAVEKLAALGYQSVVLLSSRSTFEFSRGRTLAAFEFCTRKVGLRAKYMNSERKPDHLLPDILEGRYDALLCDAPCGLMDRLKTHGIVAGRDVGLASFSGLYPSLGIGGIEIPCADIGRISVDLVIDLHYRGVAPQPFSICLPAKWSDGPSIPPRTALSRP